MVDIIFLNNGCTCETTGMGELFGYEISATVESVTLQYECKKFVEFVVNYVLSGGQLHSGETILYGYWLTKLKTDHRNRLIFFEYNAECTDFVFGVERTVSYWVKQHKICEEKKTEFNPPTLDQMVVISDGVYEGGDVQGVRYPSPIHMSGWWLTTDKYDGNIGTLKTVHSHHIAEKRPDLIKFLALPNGYRFISSIVDVWFDEKVAKEKS